MHNAQCKRARAAEAATAGAGGRALAWWQAPQYVLGALLAMIIAAIVYRIISYPGREFEFEFELSLCIEHMQ